MPILGGGLKGRDWDTERSSISTNSSATSNSASANWTSSSANKLSKLSKRIRESCRNLKAKQGKTKHFNPEDYTSFQLPNESVRSKVYVAMDFSGEDGGRVLDNPKDIRKCDKTGPTSKDGYVPFRRRVAAVVSDKLTETQANVHKSQAWFHAGLVRERAHKILQQHTAVDGVFLVRESSVSGGFVISYTYTGKLFHSQVLPVSNADGVTYTVDDGKTKFFDLLQLVEFYQLNPGTLPTRLIHYIASKHEVDIREEGGSGEQKNGTSGTTENGVKENGVGDDREENEEEKVLICGEKEKNRESLECDKMTGSSVSEGDSAMSQDGASDDESGNREQQG
ncbi:uncharacterized protein LOC111704733 [Eurytemora carolleeae]|uniref:uncharacterized protein LOC111704733 n=1 Tax=Eurytemora carolleeae TaxID=1294199 RepID=UPI000C75647E|nr:uncharacterized protein LOC111704733 [Eurytemora carolleeae]|eukprot:XP_023332832.1 uncharacterized protein LOC111704733 [Eurytemora affinis]